MSEIKPCPFCGSLNVEVRGGPDMTYVACADCYAEGPFGDFTETQAIDAWNARVTNPNVREMSDGRTT